MARFEMLRPGRRGVFTLVSDGTIGVMPVEINEHDRKSIRRLGGFLFDCEGFAQVKAKELNEEIHPGRFQPWKKYRLLTFPHSNQENDE